MNREMNRLLEALAARLVEAEKSKDPASELRRHVKMALSWLKAGAPSGASESLAKALKLRLPAETPKSAEVTALLKSAQKKASGMNPRAADEDVEKALRLLGLDK
jgi:Tfp pilus assembly protein PilF